MPMIETIVGEDGMEEIGELVQQLPSHFVPGLFVSSRLYQDLDTGEMLGVEEGDSRSERFPDRRLRYLGEGLMNVKGFDSNPDRYRLLSPVIDA